jgi:hypothetical protein
VRGDPILGEAAVGVEDSELSFGSDIFVQRFEGDPLLDEAWRASEMWF